MLLFPVPKPTEKRASFPLVFGILNASLKSAHKLYCPEEIMSLH
jgi:hypothetical protein